MKSYTMKVVVIFCTLVGISAVQVQRDLFKVKTVGRPGYLLDQRIIGGEEAVPHSYPYQAALSSFTPEGSFPCGGSLISLKYILTAAHCVDGISQVLVILGTHNNVFIDPDAKLYIVPKANITVHENYNHTSLINDIAVLELPEEVELNENIQLVSLPTQSEGENSWAGENSTFSGWGIYSNENVASTVLRHVEAKIITNELCASTTWGIVPSKICSDGSGGTSLCGGDSGGPLVVNKTQVGIASAAFCKPGSPSIFTRVTEFLDWIAANTDVVIN